MIFTTQLGIIAFGIIFAFGGILYAINYDFTQSVEPLRLFLLWVYNNLPFNEWIGATK